MEVPLLVLAVAMIPLLVVPFVVDLTPAARSAVVALDWFVWSVFAFEYGVRLVLTPDRRRFVRKEWPSLLIILLPLLRPLRIVRSARLLQVVRLLRLLAFLRTGIAQGRKLLGRHHLDHALLVAGAVILGGAGVTYALEAGEGGSIGSFGDALWWAMTTVTTVGYGDEVPVTGAGRGLAALLMVTGIAMFGLLTANLSSFLVGDKEDDAAARKAVEKRLDEVLARLERIERSLPVPPAPAGDRGLSERP